MSDGTKICVDTSDNHSIIFGSSGSKKTRLLIMPTVCALLEAGESVVVTDPKGEIYERCGGLAEKNGYKTIVLDFRELNKHRWNPLIAPYRLYKDIDTRDEGIAMLSEFLSMLTLPKDGKPNAADPFWNSTALSLSLACALILFESAKDEKDINLTNLINICSSFGSSRTDKYLESILEFIPEDSLCAVNLRPILNAAEKTKASIQVSLFSFLSMFVTNTKLQTMLSESDFTFDELASKRIALFIVIPDESNSHAEIISEFIKQSYQSLIFQAQSLGGKLPIRINYILDEFCNIGIIPQADAMLAAARSRNIRFSLVVQTNLKKYGSSEEVIKANCGNWYFLTSRDLSLLTEISNLCGTDSDSQQLISTSQLQRLSKDKGEVLILHSREYPFMSQLPDIDEYSFTQYPAPKVIKEMPNTQNLLSIQSIYEENKDVLHKWFK